MACNWSTWLVHDQYSPPSELIFFSHCGERFSQGLLRQLQWSSKRDHEEGSCGCAD
ncbi:uncharacterized protein CTRU02_207567 [Colletotrichum truncatum]|uniref:Uncharacterized protein n=1 Tax=Colletotrichum truncatum TaxID=5467 RepID=A0ACC3Z171_COLTU|nr:uncharacterized protein CTRU02_00801 [Colletotrichum truncatum]KAF6800396.1 hypothetical protein CTRU02_00801 [Colletotrichum truncatum]